ncbi:Transport protein particle (TRAPP) component [Kalmanozyma brasiliensis GHG001]|uniref:Trafficking protein particle complex subunit n=1 Tax=Kalmanozyma brasiliensis (strain GHG001) TaxID=1365824 RepID=V5EZN4_KALBG|nr:Transport protein particle (TRAPP) component [Kalmanozyma brasiliensis GHG001]EST08354.1 Transport protein particle (TRAPP) component [Kalmanozyma brasiliensis GHG001]
MTSTPRASQRFSVQTNASTSSISSPRPYQSQPDPGSAASYSFSLNGINDALPPVFSSRRTTSSTLSSSASSAVQQALVSSPPSSSRALPSIGARTSSARFASFTNEEVSTHRVGAGAVPDIVDRPRDKTRQSEIALSSLSFLFAEMVSYTQNRVTGVTDLEKRLSLLGYGIGQRLLGLTLHRQEMTGNAKNPKRETRLLPTLLWVHTSFWKAAFGKSADSLERSTEQGRGDEYMISTNVPTFSRSICVPNDMSQLSVEAITAGMVEAALDGLGFPARVTAHTVGTAQFPNRTTILIKLDKAVMDREEALATA